MKGVVFTEFLELVEVHFGFEMLTDIIDDAELDNDGAYTAVGTYHHAELVQLVLALSARTDIATPKLLQLFGRRLFTRFHELYPTLFQGIDNSFDFLESVDGHIHIEVRKLYPEAELPDISANKVSEKTLHLEYRSSRPFADFAEGLIFGCIEFFEESIIVSVLNQDEEGTHRTFALNRH